MRIKILFIISFFLFNSSCQNSFNFKNIENYEKTGFSISIKEFNKISIKNKFNEDDVVHKTLPSNTNVRIINPLNKKNILIKVNQNFKYSINREIILPEKYFSELELDSNLPLIKIETVQSNKTFTANTVKIFDEEKKVSQNIETKNVDIIDLTNKTIQKNNLKRITIYYGDFSYKESAQDMLDLLKKDVKNINPTINKINRKYRVKVVTINNVNEFDIFLNKILNTKFENYNISFE
jgi:hypothetical protein